MTGLLLLAATITTTITIAALIVAILQWRYRQR